MPFGAHTLPQLIYRKPSDLRRQCTKEDAEISRAPPQCDGAWLSGAICGRHQALRLLAVLPEQICRCRGALAAGRKTRPTESMAVIPTECMFRRSNERI